MLQVFQSFSNAVSSEFFERSHKPPPPHPSIFSSYTILMPFVHINFLLNKHAVKVCRHNRIKEVKDQFNLPWNKPYCLITSLLRNLVLASCLFSGIAVIKGRQARSASSVNHKKAPQLQRFMGQESLTRISLTLDTYLALSLS